jgi:hypothetical protein
VIDHSIFTQNADLIVTPHQPFHTSQSGPAYTLDLAAFTDAADLVGWEFSAYASYGDARCEAEKIETLSDLFGPLFEDLFRSRHRVLLAQHRLTKLHQELKQIQADITEAETVIQNNGVLVVSEQ